MLACVLHFNGVAQIRLVGAIPLHRIRELYVRPDAVDFPPISEFLEGLLDGRLDGVEDILLLDERHFHVKLVKIGRGAVGPRILVPETRRDLEILVKAGDHHQLLEYLRRLRQRVEASRMQPRRHQEIPRALGRRGGDDGRLKLGEALVPHALPEILHNRGPQHDVRVQLLAAKIQVAVSEPRFLGILLIAEHHQRQFVGCAEHFQIVNIDLDFPGRNLRVHQIVVASLHLAVYPDAPFAAHLLNLFEDRAVRIAQHLRDSVVVPQVDEQNAAVIPHPVHPA